MNKLILIRKGQYLGINFIYIEFYSRVEFSLITN